MVTLFRASGQELRAIQTTSLRELGSGERGLEDWLEKNVRKLLSEDIFWLTRQGHLESGLRTDLVGIDSAGNLVLAELKQGNVGSGAVTQILKYAAEYARNKDAGLDGIATIAGLSPDDREKLSTHVDGLELEGEINETQRLIFIGEGFDFDTLAIIRYLMEGGEIGRIHWNVIQLLFLRTVIRFLYLLLSSFRRRLLRPRLRCAEKRH
jgi:hypothetical protein